jgi:hypothetical protein
LTFLNAILALGALAFTVPLAIHLLFRSRFKTVQWGAMHLLDSVVRINRRRIQLLHLLLLLLRCLLPVLLAFCLARPVLTGFQSLPGSAPQSLILAIDDSRSMSARDDLAVRRIDRAKQGLVTLLGQLSRRDEVILIRSSSVDAPPATMGTQDAVRRVREIQSESGPVDLGRLLRAAADAADDASHQQRRIVIVSDFQSHNLHQGAIESIGRLATLLAEKSVRPVISFLNFGVESNHLDNVLVESIDVDSPAVVAGRGARFSARIRNASDTPLRDLRLVWSIGGKPLDPRTVSIPPRSSVIARLSHRIDEVGVKEVTVAIEHGDALIEDNRRSIAVDVIQEIDVMLVDGKPSSQPLQGETDFLAIALSPFAFGGEDQPDAVRTVVVRDQRLAKEIEAKQPDIVILANVGMLRNDAKQAVARFVSGGGALVVFDGDGIDPDAYNEAWTSGQESWLLPARLEEFVGSSASREATPLPIGEVNRQYSPWHILGGPNQQPFGNVDVYGYRKLSIIPNGNAGLPDNDDGVDTDTSAIKLLSMANGDPLIVSARRGRGRIVQFAVPCDTAWTSFPTRLVYLPMMQQLVLDLAGSRKQTTVDVGTGFSVPTSETSSLLPEEAKPSPERQPTFTLGLSGKPEVPIQPSDDVSPRLLVATTTQPGTYRIRQMTPMAEGKPLLTSTLRVVEVPAIESQLRDVDPSRLAAAAEAVQANLYLDVETLQADDRTRRFGREIWRWLLVGLLVVMIAEVLLQQRSIRAPLVGAS